MGSVVMGGPAPPSRGCRPYRGILCTYYYRLVYCCDFVAQVFHSGLLATHLLGQGVIGGFRLRVGILQGLQVYRGLREQLLRASSFLVRPS